jgi:diguanylate cyclase (GGDEF)-like protein/PAS domain S-box-containing protein
MTTAPPSLAAPARRAALDATGLLDAPAGAAFDRVARLAAALLHAPVALVTLVDAERQRVVGCHGLPEPWASRRETPRSSSFCEQVVGAAAPLIVDDTRARLPASDAPATGAPGMAAYAGVPLATPDGHVLGALCAIDRAPRAWPADAAALLTELAGVVMTEIALRAEVTARVHAEAALHAGAAEYRDLVERLPYIVYQNAPEPPYAPRYVSPAVRDLGYSPAAYERADFWARVLHADDRERVLRETAEARAAGAPVDSEYRVCAADGTVRWLHDRGAPVLGADGRPVVWQGVMVDVTERKALEAELMRQASEDGLTGLANRSRLLVRIRHALGAAAGDAGPAVLLIDLDDFKRVNDSLGHAAGDRLLELVAGRLLNATRGSDTVARLGGDEFAVLLAAVRGGAEVAVVADRIVTALSEPFVVDGRHIRVGASIGLAVAAIGETPDDLLRNADLALYRAKGTGKGRHAAFAPEMHTAAVTRLELEAELRQAVAQEQLVLHYQPIIDLATRSVTGAEALVRWQHPERGLLPPSHFIPLAEATELVVPVGRWVLRTACAAAAAWRTTDAGGRRLSVSVNVSGRQLQRGGFVEDVAEALRASGLAASRLVLEVTESVLLADLEMALQRLEALRALGVRVALDDFGTGYSSLAYLQRLPVDVLKIDRAFTADITAGGRRAALARAVVTLADTLGLHTVAEGVETEAQHDELRALGCGFAQGFLYARPLGVDAFAAFVAAAHAGAAHAGAAHAGAAHAGAATPAGAPPAAPPTASPPARRAAGRSTGEATAGAAGVAPATVLVVEDEPQVRRTVARVLRGAGYEVVEAGDGAEALRLFAAHPAAVDLVLTDIVMPELNGRSLADALDAHLPGTRVLLMSGYDPAQIAGRGVTGSDRPVLDKPFTHRQLLDAVRDALAPVAA